MAQRTIHYLFVELLSRNKQINHKERFLLGSVLPDAYSENFERDITHFTRNTDEYVYFDFEEFRKQYGELICKDELYLGYYMHLIEDAFYRIFLFDDRFKKPTCKDDVVILYNDYHILNNYIVENYKIENIITEYKNVDEEQIFKLAHFRVDDFLQEMKNDFIEKTTGTTYFVTENMLDEFVEKYKDLAEKEFDAVKNGYSILNIDDYMWKRNV